LRSADVHGSINRLARPIDGSSPATATRAELATRTERSIQR
jgi:hypothetical protein